MNDKFLITKEYKKFAEFCDECKNNNYIGLCYGTPGVGKTLSAKHYSNWDIIKSILPPDHLTNPIPVDEITNCDSIFYTAPVSPSRARIEREILNLSISLNWLIGDIVSNKIIRKGSWYKQHNHTKLLIIDEADRLRPVSLEQIRDFYDINNIAIIFIGMPGIEKKLSRYAQLYSRVGFVHNFQPISKEEIKDIIKSKARDFNLKCNFDDVFAEEALVEIVKITRGNFRLIQRLVMQIERIMRLNKINDLRKDVVETAKESLITGTI